MLSDRQGIRQQFHIFCQQIPRVQGLLPTFRSVGQRKSHLFTFSTTYMDMVQILHDFIRPECWELAGPPAIVARMAPYFFAMGRCNYARWLPVYLADMHRLPQKHPAVFEQFMNVEHTVTRSSQPFSQVWSDMTLKQSIHIDSRKKGGIIGITQKPGALVFLSSHERAVIASATKTMCDLEGGERIGSHKEGTPRGHAPYICRLTLKSANQLTIRPWISVQDEGKTLIWHSDFFFFHFFPRPPLQVSHLWRLQGGGGGYAPFPKFLDPPLHTAVM